MENQHRKITGYRELSQLEINAMNMVKAEGENLKALISELSQQEHVDKRWVAIAETHLQQGIMAAVRSIAKPNSF